MKIRIRYIPALSTLALIVIFVLLYVYALQASSSTPMWGQWLILALVVIVSIVGIAASARLKSAPQIKAAYIAGMLLCLLGTASFYYVAHYVPAAINLFGLLAIVVGTLISAVASIIIAVRDRA